MKPNFLVIGSGKCGTTTLCDLLGQHPEIFVSSPKEPNFFSYDHIYTKGWHWYESLFDNANGALARGEGSVSYSLQAYEDRVCERILNHLPDVRLIYIVRNPLSRIESNYKQHHHSGHQHKWYLPFSLKDALQYLPQMLINTLYWQRINAFRSHFPDEHILVLFLEDLMTNPNAVLSRCFEFLGVDSSVMIKHGNRRLNTGDTKYYDKRPMRFIRTHGTLNAIWTRFPGKVQRMANPIMRKRFTGQLKWEPSIRDWVMNQIAEDSLQFLKFYGKPPNFWDIDSPTRESTSNQR
jgi:hypothetical protein